MSVCERSPFSSSSLFELLDGALARLLDQALLDVGRKLDRVDAEVAEIVELDHGVA